MQQNLPVHWGSVLLQLFPWISLWSDETGEFTWVVKAAEDSSVQANELGGFMSLKTTGSVRVYSKQAAVADNFFNIFLLYSV